MFPLIEHLADLRENRFFTPVAIALALIVGVILILQAVAPANATAVLIETGANGQLADFDPFNP